MSTARPAPCVLAISVLAACSLSALSARAQAPAESTEPEQTPSGGARPAEPAVEDDGWPDLSTFLDSKLGFLPIASPITEPAVGYGAAGGLMFLSKSFGDVAAGLGRPNITVVGGMGTSNGTWGALAADIRYWL